MRWLLAGLVILAAAAEGLMLSDYPVFGVKLPLTWLAVLFITINQWAGWRQTLVITASAGYLLDVLAAPQPATVLIPLLLAWLSAQLLLHRGHYGRSAKLGAILAGSSLYLSGSFAVGPYNPGWLIGWYLAVYSVAAAGAYWIISQTALNWLRRL